MQPLAPHHSGAFNSQLSTSLSPLPQRPFGSTGTNLPALGFGGGFVNFSGFDRSVETVRHALKLGIRYFDTR